MQTDFKKILLHTCCAPCASAAIERLLQEGWQPVLYFFMPNIYPYEEYLKRLSYVEKLAAHFNVELLEGFYNYEDWLASVEAYKSAPEGGARCFLCYDYLLKATSLKAQELQIETFATALTISPRKNSKKIEELGTAYDNYTHFDFKKRDGYKRSIELSKELDLYRQCYCACEFSMQRLTRLQEKQAEALVAV